MNRLRLPLALLPAIVFVWSMWPACAAEYTGRYLYAEPNPADPGGIRLKLTPEGPKPRLAVAIGQRSRQPYLGQLQADGSFLFAHLPVDKYDLLLVADKAFYEGIELVRLADLEIPADEAAAIAAEVEKIEGFFDRKQIHRTARHETKAGVLLQQWRHDTALKQSGEKVAGFIHSLDLIWFEKPLKGWQLEKRRQIYREELADREPLHHHRVDALGGVLVVTSIKEVGPLALP